MALGQSGYGVTHIHAYACAFTYTSTHTQKQTHSCLYMLFYTYSILTDTYLCVDEQKHTHTGFSFDAKDDHVLELPIGIRRSPVTNLAYKGSIAVY